MCSALIDVVCVYICVRNTYSYVLHVFVLRSLYCTLVGIRKMSLTSAFFVRVAFSLATFSRFFFVAFVSAAWWTRATQRRVESDAGGGGFGRSKSIVNPRKNPYLRRIT